MFRTSDYKPLNDQWHAYLDAALKEFVQDWAEANKVAITDDLKPNPKGEQSSSS